MSSSSSSSKHTTNSTSSTLTSSIIPTSSFTSSTTTSAADSLTNATLTTPTTSTTGPGDRNSNGSGNQNPAASASLYLYTFLATLVLLLSVSAAIILRSLLLRRRHRRMVEEAIRNGTWVPPSPGGSTFPFGANGRRVDLSKKPKMWEAFVGGREHQAQKVGQAEAVTEWEWDSIRPFAAAYVSTPGTSDAAPVVSIATPPQVVQPSLSDRVKGFFDRSRRTPPAAAAAPSTQTPTEIPMTAATTAVPPTAAPLLDGTPAPADLDPPQKVRVAVLIAMPHPPESRSRSPTPTPVASTSAVVPSHSLIDEEEPDLPHIEFGVAELDVSVSPPQSTRVKDVRSSVASGSSMV